MASPDLAESILKGRRINVTYPQGHHASIHVLDYFHPRVSTGLGQPRTFVLLGGLAIAWFDWQDLTLELGESDRVIVFDRAGMGLSGPAPYADPSDLIDEADVVRQVLDHFQVDSAHVVGHSMGGLVAEAFARRYPQRCARLALLDTSYESDQPSENHIQVPLPALTEFMTRQASRLLTSSPVAARVFAAIRARTKRTPLATARRADELRVSRAVFTRSHILSGLLREYRGYDQWVAQLAALREETELACPAIVVAAQSAPVAIMGESWVNHLRELAVLLAGTDSAVDEALATGDESDSEDHAAADADRVEDAGDLDDQEITVVFRVVRASHLLMRDIPVEVAGLLTCVR